MLRFPRCLDSRLTDGGEVSAFLVGRPTFTPRKIPGTYLREGLSVPQGHIRVEGLGKREVVLVLNWLSSAPQPRVGVWICGFTTSPLDGRSGQLHVPSSLPPGRDTGTQPVGGSASPRAWLDAMERRKRGNEGFQTAMIKYKCNCKYSCIDAEVSVCCT
jgi:hypothetical protein